MVFVETRVTAQDALTFHRPPREYPPAVPSEPLRIAPPPTQPPPPHTSIIQLLFPVVGGVGMVGFALVYGNSTFLYIAGAMLVLLLAFSFGMRWSQKRGVRKRAAAGRAPLREVPARARGRAGRGGRAPARRAGAAVPGARAPVDAARQAAARLGAPAGPPRLPARAARHRRRCRSTATVELDLGHEPARRVPAAVAAGGAQDGRAARDAARRAGRRRPRRGRRPGGHRRPRARAGLDARADRPARRRARAARPAAADRVRRRRDADAWEWGKWLPAPARRPRRARRPSCSPARRRTLEALLEPELRPRLDQLRRLAEADVRVAARCRWSRPSWS